ncbi:uncharacterized protein [Struthio camelus]|uniref:uncharacterized protein n=1 Tax=Struthio camelus TaxID=8801 RepID=UPI0036042C16
MNFIQCQRETQLDFPALPFPCPVPGGDPELSLLPLRGNGEEKKKKKKAQNLQIPAWRCRAPRVLSRPGARHSSRRASPVLTSLLPYGSHPHLALVALAAAEAAGTCGEESGSPRRGLIPRPRQRQHGPRVLAGRSGASGAAESVVPTRPGPPQPRFLGRLTLRALLAPGRFRSSRQPSNKHSGGKRPLGQRVTCVFGGRRRRGAAANARPVGKPWASAALIRHRRIHSAQRGKSEGQRSLPGPTAQVTSRLFPLPCINTPHFWPALPARGALAAVGREGHRQPNFRLSARPTIPRVRVSVSQTHPPVCSPRCWKTHNPPKGQARGAQGRALLVPADPGCSEGVKETQVLPPGI